MLWAFEYSHTDKPGNQKDVAAYFQTRSLGRPTGKLGGGGMANLGVNLTHLGRGTVSRGTASISRPVGTSGGIS